MAFNEIKITKGAFTKKALIEEFDNSPKTDNKTKMRKSIQENVFDDRDAIADNAKMISLLLTLTSKVYSILPKEQKDLLSVEDKTVIEYVFEQFKLTNTRADIQFQKEGVAMIDKLLNRQELIGKIIN